MLFTYAKGTYSSQDVAVRPSTIQGMGLYALRTFEPGEVVLRWDLSHTISNEELALLSPEERRYVHPFNGKRAIIVQPPERFVNHSCNNNTKVRDFCDIAVRRIAPGEEITSDYSADGSGSKFTCLCGEENCRGKVGS
jgi:SET domain-containing protein